MTGTGQPLSVPADGVVSGQASQQRDLLERTAARRYVLHAMLPFAMMVLAVGILNLSVDPYMLRSNDVTTFKPAPTSLRLTKPLQVIARNPETIFLGSSRTLLGIDPQYVGPNAYNFGISGLTAPELEVLGLHCLEWTDVKKLVINSDDFMFDARASFEGGLGPDVSSCRHMIESLIAATLSLDSLKDCGRAFLPSNHRGMWRADGFMTSAPKTGSDIREVMDLLARKPVARPSAEQFACLDRLLAACAARNVETLIYMPPIHQSLLDALNQRDGNQTFADYRYAIRTIASKHDVACYDFSPPHRLASIPLAEPNALYTDPAHYTARVGNLMLFRMGFSVLPASYDMHFLNDFGAPAGRVQFAEATTPFEKN